MAFAYARAGRWARAAEVPRVVKPLIGVAILIAMVVIPKVHWPYAVRLWVPEVESGLIFVLVVGGILARLTAPRLERDGRVIPLQRDAGRIQSIRLRPAVVRKAFNWTYATRPNHICLVATLA